MSYHLDRTERYSFATITDPESAIAYAIISIDFHGAHTLEEQALTLLYPELFLSGAGEYSREEFLHAMNSLGASIATAINDDVLTITLRSTTETFPKLLKLLAVAIDAPRFLPSELKRVQGIATNMLHEHRENSKAIAHEQLKNSLYSKADRKYTYDLSALTAAVQQVKPAELKAFHSLIQKQFWCASMTGDVMTIKRFNTYLQQVTKRHESNESTSASTQNKSRQQLLTTNIPSRQNIDFSIGAPIPFTLHHPDYIPLMFGLAVLGKWGGFAGRLMSTVREKEGLTYGIYATLDGFSGSEPGYWRVMTFFAPDKALQGVTSTYREIANIYKHGITQQEFDTFKTILTTTQTLLQDSVTNQLADFHAYNFRGFSLDEMQAHKNKIHTITIAEVNTAIKTYLNPATLTISAAGPTAKVKKDLQTFLKNI